MIIDDLTQQYRKLHSATTEVIAYDPKYSTNDGHDVVTSSNCSVSMTRTLSRNMGSGEIQNS